MWLLVWLGVWFWFLLDCFFGLVFSVFFFLVVVPVAFFFILFWLFGFSVWFAFFFFKCWLVDLCWLRFALFRREGEVPIQSKAPPTLMHSLAVHWMGPYL